LFLKSDQGLEWAGGTSARALAAPGFGRAAPMRQDWRTRAAAIDWVPDLGMRIGSAAWWRGLATCTALCAATLALAPGIRPLVGTVPSPLAGADAEAARAQGVAPIALGSTTGRVAAATEFVRPLTEVPERPRIELSATLGQGDSFGRALERAGVGRPQAQEAARLVGGVASLADIPAGSRIALTLGRRSSRAMPRPLERLALRARFDLAVAVVRDGAGLRLERTPIAVDHTPLRLQGLVGTSLYRSARAAGVPARAVEAYIKALATRVSIGRDVHAADSFDMVIARDRAATGETKLGELLFAGLDQGRRSLRMLRWTGNGEREAGWFDAAGQAERRGYMGMPVAGRVTSNFGLRMHPLLGFMRMHKGIDIAAPYGAPILAAIDGVVASAGRNAGYGNFVRLTHGGGLSSGYGHMSRIAVRGGQRVRQGQVIGYIGSTGLSTGPHLHWEVWRNGQSINPRSISFASVARLSGENLRAFKRQVQAMLAVKPGA
jgi:murein DD-endopeptidase MepM/ murein hydrolase activator NlpD